MMKICALVLGGSFAGQLLAACDDNVHRDQAEVLPSRDDSVETREQEAATDNREQDTAAKGGEGDDDEIEAEAEFAQAGESKIDGEVEFVDRGDGVEVVARIDKATPGKHGFHIHEKGDCSSLADKSMGAHFNPGGHSHALPAGEAHHLGDMGNIDIAEDGKGTLRMTIKDANLRKGDARSLLGKAVVFHAGEDMGKDKQPSGDSGTPVGCAVIEES